MKKKFRNALYLISTLVFFILCYKIFNTVVNNSYLLASKSTMMTSDVRLIDDFDNFELSKKWKTDGVIERTTSSNSGRHALHVRDANIVNYTLHGINIREFEWLSLYLKGKDQIISVYFQDSNNNQSKVITIQVKAGWDEYKINLKSMLYGFGLNQLNPKKTTLFLKVSDNKRDLFVDDIYFGPRYIPPRHRENMLALEHFYIESQWKGSGNIHSDQKNIILTATGPFDNGFVPNTQARSFFKIKLLKEMSNYDSLFFWIKSQFVDNVEIKLISSESNPSEILYKKLIRVSNHDRLHEINLQSIDKQYFIEGVTMTITGVDSPNKLYLSGFNAGW